MELNQLSHKFRLIPLLFLFYPFLAYSVSYPNEDIQKAKIIKQIATVVSWPSNKDNVLNLCLLGEFGPQLNLEGLQDSRVNKYKINIKKVDSLKNAKSGCQFIYISQSEENNLIDIIKAFDSKPVLLLGDMDGFAQKGGSMNFMRLNKFLALTINMEALKKSNLKIDMKAYDQVTIFPEESDLDSKKP